ncbi:glycosyl hydrolase 2 galactose-binding domain-containing protein, partial [Candidatus Caldatribacterium sp.]|uniref:glycosyl hydrolase 2 galactose-binding domain-containing protein n=1 Tax=Candidatus Caldatribacterium sp. TaxID=2282143 RepID=UPI00384436B4|nr:hypothetical protein [Candidatus Caldatribacterium sp.]
MEKISLDGLWTLEAFRYGEGLKNNAHSPDYIPQNAIPAYVPGEVHLDLLRAGQIEEPLFGENAKRCQWLEEREWWYRKEFEVPEALLTLPTELVFESIDTDCDIFLNGEHIAHHENMFVPLILNVSGKIARRNTLVVRVDAGVQRIAHKTFIPYPAGSPEQDYRRVWVRKAQFTFAWDWAPRLVNVGIPRSVYLRFFNGFALRDVFLQAKVHGKNAATITISGQVENFSRDFACEPKLTLRALLFEEEGRKLAAVKDIALRAYPGFSNFAFSIDLS